MTLPDHFTDSFLYALCEISEGRSVRMNEDKFHKAFRGVIDLSAELAGVPQLDCIADPYTGRYREMDEILMHGVRREIIYTNRNATMISPILSADVATKLLENEPGRDHYRRLAGQFWQEISPP